MSNSQFILIVSSGGSARLTFWIFNESEERQIVYRQVALYMRNDSGSQTGPCAGQDRDALHLLTQTSAEHMQHCLALIPPMGIQESLLFLDTVAKAASAGNT